MARAAVRNPYDTELLRDLAEKRDRVAAWAGRLPGVAVWPTPATFYTFWDVTGCFGKKAPDGRVIAGSEDLAVWLIERAGVVTAPGAAFMQEGYLRLSFAVPGEEIDVGFAAAAEALAELA